MLKISSNKKYLNKTEAIYDKLKVDDLFVQDDWDTFTKRGEINSYISTMNSDNLPSLQELNDKYHYDRMDADRRWLVRYNNLFADKTEKKDWDIKTINSQTGEEETIKFNGTEYEYNEKLLSDWVTYDNEQIRLESEQERKDNMSWLEKGFHTVVATGGELLSGLYTGVSDLVNLIDAAGQWIGSGFEEKAFRNAMTDDKTLFGVTRYNDDFMRSLAEYESNNTYYRNVDGTFTSDFAETMQSVFYSIGEALPMILATYVSGGASTAASAYAKGISGFTKGAVKGLTVAQKIAKVAPVVAQTGYYLSMASGRIEDRLKSSPSASTSAVLAEAGWSTLLDYGVNVGMAKLFGPTTMDKIVFGFSGNKGKLTGISKFIVESAREGMEESIQEFTAWFATEVVSWSENSGIYGEKLTFEQISKAFFAGAMSNILMGGLDSATRAVSEHRNLKAFYTENGLYEIEDKAERVKKRNLLKNGYKYLQAFETVKANADAGEVDIQLATSVYSAFRMYATAMGIFTDEDFKDTQHTLDVLMQDYEKNKNNANKYINASLIKDFALDLNNKLETRTEETKKAIEILQKVNAEKQLQENKQKELKDAFVKGEMTFVTGKETEKATKKADQIVNKNDDVKGIVTTEQGTGISFVDGWLFIPSDALNNASVEDIYKTTAERRITEDSITALDKIDNNIVNQILDWYKKYSDNSEASKPLAMKALFFDRTFYKMCLYNADRKMFNVLSMLNDIAKTVSGKNFDDAQYRQAINTISENMRSELRLYLSYLPTQQYNELVADSRSVLTDDDAAFIEKQRYEQDVIAKKLNAQKLTKEELASLFNKINSLTIPADEKQLIYDGLQNSDNKVRKFALYQLNNYYNGIFEGKFNNEIYPRIQTTADSMLALFLQQEGITLKDIKQPTVNKQFIEKVESKYGKFNNDTKRQYLLDTFNGVDVDGKHYKGFGKDNFTMTIDANNKITVTENEVVTDDAIARRSTATLNKQVNYSGFNFGDMKFARPVDKNSYSMYRKTMDKLLNGKLSKVEKSLVTITDIIRDPQRYLSPDARGQIRGRLNQTNTFAYLNSVLTAASDGSIGIEQKADGTYEIASYSDLHTFIPDAKKNMQASNEARKKSVADGPNAYATKNTNQYVKYGTTNNGVHNIDEFIDAKFLPGRLKDIEVRVKLATKENRGSSYQNGIITIREYRPGIALSDTEFYFALMHEFEHAIQEYNNWNTGFDSIQGQASDTLIKDMFEHIPNLFEGYTLADLKDNKKRQDMLNIANNYIYYSTNELGANGLRTQDGFKTYNQIIVQETEIPNGKNVGIRTDIVFPWGSRYSITGALIKKLNAYTDTNDLFEIIPKKYLQKFYNIAESYDKLSLPTDVPIAEDYINSKYYNDYKRDSDIIDNYQGKHIGKDDSNIIIEDIFKNKNKEYLEYLRNVSMIDYKRKFYPELNIDEFLNLEVPFFRLQEGPHRDDSIRSIFAHINPNEKILDIGSYVSRHFGYMDGTNYYITVGTIKLKDIAYMKNAIYEGFANINNAQYYKNYAIHVNKFDTSKIITDIDNNIIKRRNVGAFKNDPSVNYDVGPFDKDFLTQEKIPEIDIILEEGHISKSKDFTERKQAPSHTRRSKRAEQPTNKGNRQVSRKAAKDTLLEYYTAKVKTGENLPQMTPNMQTFLKTSNGSKLDKRLMKGDGDITFKFEKHGKDTKTIITSIEDGNLLQDQVMRFLRKADTMNNYTFDQINKAFFNNSNITSLEELDSIINLDLGDVYAIRASLRGTEFENLSHISTSIDAMRANIESFKSSPTFAKYMAREKSTAERFYNTPIDKGYARAAIMTHYDGTIDSLAAVAGFVKSIYDEKRNTADQLAAQSLDKNLKNKKGDTDDRTLYDKIKGGEDSAILYESDFDIKIQRVIAHFEKLATNAVDAEIEKRTKQGKKTTEEQRQKAIDKNLAQRLAKLSGETYDENKSAKQYKDEALSEDTNVIETLLDKWYTRITMEELYEIEAEKISEEVVEAYTPSVTAISKRIRGKINSMRPHLVKHPEQYNNLPSEIQGLIDQNTFEIVKENDETVLKGKSLNELVELDKIITETAEKVYTNSVVSKEVKKTNERLQKELAKEKDKNAKLTKQVKTYKNKVTKKPSKTETVSNITITSNTEIPSLLDKIMSVSMSKYSKSMVQHLNNDDERHLRASMKEFFEQNADNFEQMTTEDALEIMKFLASHLTPDLTSKDARVWTAFAEYTLAYIYQQVFTYNSFDFTQDEKDMLKLIVENARALPGSAMAAVGNSLEMVNPVKVVLMNLKSWQNIDTTTLEPIVDDMLKDVVKGDTDALAKTNKRLYDELLRLYRDNGAVDIYDKILKFQKAAMLSAPATIIRNKVSNEVIKHTNKWADVIGKKVHEAFRKSKLGTKINQFLSKRARQKLEKQTRAKLGEKATAQQILDEMKNRHVNLDEQYDFVNLEVSEDVEGFTKANLIDSGLLDLLQDGMPKYDIDAGLTDFTAAAVPFANRTDVAIVKNIVKALKSRITMNETYDHKRLNKLVSLVFKAQSDDKWIRNTALTYFNKMLQQKVNTDKNFSLKNGLNQTSMGLFVQAYSAAAYDYMHRSNFITTMERALLSRNRAAYIVWKLIMPFGSSAMNWFIESLDYTPIGIFKGIYNLANLEQNILKKEDKLRSGQDLTVGVGFTQMYARRALGKGIIGTALIMFGLLLGHFGIIAVDEEDDKLKINIKGTDFYVDISNIFTSSSILLGAQLTNPRKGNFEDVFKDTVDMILDDTLFGNIVDITKYGLGNWAVRLIPNTLAGFVPNLWKSVMRMTNNHEVSYSSGFIGAWQNFLVQTLPFIEYALPKYIDPYTGEWKSKYRIPALFQFINIISPANVKCYDYSDVEKVYAEHNIHNKMLEGDDKVFGGIKLDKVMLNQKYGTLNNAEAKLFINNKKAYSIEVTDKNGKKQMKEMLYRDMNYEQRKSVLNRITTKNARLAKIYTWTQMGHKYYASKELRAELGSIGASKNVFIGDKGYVK